jgi:ESCRT-I complex subunit TSG101
MPTAAVLTQPPNVNQPFVYASGPLHPLDSVQIISSPTPKPAQPVPNLLEEETNESTSSALVQPQIAAPVPPRPLNPELLSLHARVHAKISADLASVTKALALDGERLRANQTDLLAGEPAIRDEMARLEAVKDVCRSVVTRMRANVEQAERNIAELRRKGDPEVDELVCSTTIVHNQYVHTSSIIAGSSAPAHVKKSFFPQTPCAD